jgi:UDP-hydrolysing UDP-N-acetyl-D-glucosamine 2-epimerase
MKKTRRKICVVTGSRAEYGLLRGLMREIADDKDLILQVIATGAHLLFRFGSTYKQILNDGFKIDAKVNMRLDSDQDKDIASATGEATQGFARAFKKLKPEIVVLLGDRFEILAAATSATLLRIPIAHIHGGEVTEGAYDDAIRHAITKMAFIHFAAHEDYAQRIIQMGEDPGRVFNCGAPGLDSIRNLKLLSRKQLEKDLNFKPEKEVALVTFHPVTMEKGSAARQTKNLLQALDESGLRMIFTMPNADAENSAIFKQIASYVKKHSGKAKLVKSLGQLKYLSLLKHVGLMIGNSSSGIIEAPSFKLPVVNVGSRQRGRIRAKNVIDTACESASIKRTIRRARSKSFGASLKALKNPFGDGRASRRIKNVLKRADLKTVAKGFYDLLPARKDKERIVLVGGGGHCKVVVEAIQKGDFFSIAGVVDKNSRSGSQAGNKVLGDDSCLEEVFSSGCKNAFITVGSVGNPAIRMKLAKKLEKIGFNIPVIAHPSAVIAKSAKTMDGVFIGPRAVVGPGSVLGKHAIVNTRASVDHDCRVGDFAHIAPGAILSGGVKIGNNAHIGTGASVIQYKKIGNNAMIGAGSVVVKNIPEGSKAYGNPCRIRGRNHE